jgi:ABC-type branched-subunit amino acid transport system ATPase component
MAKNLPYGDQRRLEIARALASKPKLLLLDEPTAGMNPSETQTMMNLIHRLRDELGITILLIEHQMRVVVASRAITVLDYGAKIAEEPRNSENPSYRGLLGGQRPATGRCTSFVRYGFAIFTT